MVPALSTTANTITAHSSRLTDIVMLAKAGNWCMNSRSCSEKQKVYKENDNKVKLKYESWVTITLNIFSTLNFLQVYKEFCHCGKGHISLLIQEQQDSVRLKFQWRDQ